MQERDVNNLKLFFEYKFMTGRHSTFTQEIADEICQAVSVSTESLKTLCDKHAHWPEFQTVHKWRNKHKSFDDDYARAKQKQADIFVEQILEIAENNSNDTIIDAEGTPRSNHAAVQRDRLRVDAIKWIACKLLPKVYGDKQQVDANITVNHEDSLKGLE